MNVTRFALYNTGEPAGLSIDPYSLGLIQLGLVLLLRDNHRQQTARILKRRIDRNVNNRDILLSDRELKAILLGLSHVAFRRPCLYHCATVLRLSFAGFIEEIIE